MSIRFVLPLPAIALAFGVARLAAQSDPAEWARDCRRNERDDKPRVCLVREASMRPAGGTLTVDPGRNGGVAVYGWDRDSIAVTARIVASARTEEAARRLADEIRIEAAGRTIRAVGPDEGFREHWSVSFDVYVPRQTDLSLETLNGPLSVEDVSGTMDLRAQNGPVSLHGVSGDVTARVQNGPLSVHLSGTRWDGVGLDAEAHNGPVDLAIPERYNAKLETGTANGPMDLAFPLTVTMQGRLNQRIQSTLGQGGATVRVVTTNGPLTIRRAH
jgi:hypothetical protein